MTELLTPIEVAAQLRVSRRTLERLVAQGRIRPVRIGRLPRFEQREIDAYVASLRRAA
jgi:excisionase family DNA binding protein